MLIVLILVSIVLLLLLQGFFSGSEIALVHCDKSKLRHKAKEGKPGSALALKMFERPEVALTTTLVGTNIALVLFTVLGTTLMISLFGQTGELLAIVVLVPLTLIFGEVVPKSVFQQESDRLTPKIIYPLYLLSILLFPVVFLFSRVARLAASIIGDGKPGAELFAVREQLRAVLETAEGVAPESPFDRIRVRNVVRFGELSAGDLMIPAAEMTAIDANSDISDAIKLVRKTGYTHVPVYEGKRSNIKGLMSLTVWNLVEPEFSQRELSSIISSGFYVPALQSVAELLPILRGREDQTAIVVDEYGSAVGLISVDMILESIVGNVEVGTNYEERDIVTKPSYEDLGEGAYMMDARLPIADVNEILATKISTAVAHTLGGLMVARLRHVPKRGESLIEDGFLFTVEEATDRAVTKLHVKRPG